MDRLALEASPVCTMKRNSFVLKSKVWLDYQWDIQYDAKKKRNGEFHPAISKYLQRSELKVDVWIMLSTNFPRYLYALASIMMISNILLLLLTQVRRFKRMHRTMESRLSDFIQQHRKFLGPFGEYWWMNWLKKRLAIVNTFSFRQKLIQFDWIWLFISRIKLGGLALGFS